MMFVYRMIQTIGRQKKLGVQGFAWALHGEILLVERRTSIRF
jgi:hypothetical protein